MIRDKISRRQFIKHAAAIAGASIIPACKSSYSATVDQVALGNTGLKLSQLGMGTGSHGGNVQRSLMADGFNRLVRYAYERGITYIDTAEAYKTHTWVREAIKDLPREKFFIMTKMSGIPENPLEKIDIFRKELGVDYIDCLLIHCKIHGNWDETHKKLMDAFEEAKQKKIILSHGVSCHSLPALKKAASLDWVDVNLVRMNPQGVKTDTMKETFFDDSKPADMPPVLEQVKMMKQKGNGIIGMKIIGEGDFTELEDRKKAMRYAFQAAKADAVVIGFKNTAEIDEAISNMKVVI